MMIPLVLKDDFLGIGKAAEKLIEVVNIGIGTVYKPINTKKWLMLILTKEKRNQKQNKI